MFVYSKSRETTDGKVQWL